MEMGPCLLPECIFSRIQRQSQSGIAGINVNNGAYGHRVTAIGIEVNPVRTASDTDSGAIAACEV
jgi:hypothetical protein